MADSLRVPSYDEEIEMWMQRLEIAKSRLWQTGDVEEKADCRIEIGRCSQKIRQLQTRQRGGY